MQLDVTWEDFGKMIRQYRYEHREQRNGQATFNVFSTLCPECADKVRNRPDLDPFYDDDKLPIFMQTIRKMFKGE